MKALLSLVFALCLAAPALAQEADGGARPALSPGQAWTIAGEGQADARLTIQRPSRRAALRDAVNAAPQDRRVPQDEGIGLRRYMSP